MTYEKYIAKHYAGRSFDESHPYPWGSPPSREQWDEHNESVKRGEDTYAKMRALLPGVSARVISLLLRHDLFTKEAIIAALVPGGVLAKHNSGWRIGLNKLRATLGLPAWEPILSRCQRLEKENTCLRAELAGITSPACSTSNSPLPQN